MTDKKLYLVHPSDFKDGFEIFRRGHGGTLLLFLNEERADQVCKLLNEESEEIGRILDFL